VIALTSVFIPPDSSRKGFFSRSARMTSSHRDSKARYTGCSFR
jgi:hypothetical protein